MKKNEVKIFNKEDFSVRAVVNEDGSISINAEDAAIGFGWTQVKADKVYPKWERINGFCRELGFSPQVGKDDYIPEALFYRLGMKASNERAEKFQNWLAFEVLPEIRKTGSYSTPKKKKEECLASINNAAKILTPILEKAGIGAKIQLLTVKSLYQMCRKTPCFSYGDIRHFHRIYASN